MKIASFFFLLLLIISGCNTEPDVTPSPQTGLSIYPNPALDYINIVVYQGGSTSIEVIDDNGESFHKATIVGNAPHMVSLELRSSGVYQVIAETNEKTIVQEFIKL